MSFGQMYNASVGQIAQVISLPVEISTWITIFFMVMPFVVVCHRLELINKRVQGKVPSLESLSSDYKYHKL
jgi:hypothetical protein